MRATVKDVAARAGVSPKTVSNVVNGLVPVSSATRAKVEAALAELDYVPNLSARGLRNGRTGLIGLALPDLGTPYSAELAHHVVEAAHALGWAVQIEETGKDPQREFELVSRARANMVDGLILNPVALNESAIRTGGSLPPMVLLGEVSQQSVDQVAVDNIAAAREMTRALARHGRRRIAVLGANGTRGSATALVRTQGYREAMAELGLPTGPELEIVCDAWSPAGSAAALRSYLAAGHPLPEAIFCFTDSLAIGALSVLHAAGHRVPEDVIVAGFDDIADGQFAVPALTTVAVDKAAMAQTAVRLLTERMADPGRSPVHVQMPHRLIERDSTGLR
ncbi:LacI family DNA-binding transcriptional regulator [Arthrobacter sp. N199823]|uniref:LacI family DNA-binding transcriptional regulator n=1 Tax=Arthrobacter sp. N199823 TaxID=2058895 RepID=UPI000CE49C91|nr:LacI family DNA-binding transcriptional regulator [Arthrobacter sp. N199823]